ncbi:hypothetical protein CVT25_009002 [Psilocybe cyanescens]|uniref:Uncharacterized protein n=1 Tax=Psilocybe cyanescens TaxID=93625 RepID=A0A409XNA2_PSICY|nr:hypothetical protein CVT25_009002 [Psilocybe cyanescens]
MRTIDNRVDPNQTSDMKEPQSLVDDATIMKKFEQRQPDVIEKGNARPAHVDHLHHVQNMAESIEASTASQTDNESNHTAAIADKIQDSLD